MHSVVALLVRVGCAVAMALAVVGVTAPVSAGAPDSPLCAWRFMSNSTVLNVAFPDANSTYWLMPYALGPGDSIELSGTYPAARYFSLNTYGTNLDTVDTLRDNQIVADPGSANPYVDASAAALPPEQRQWHATLVNGPADHSRNEIQAVAPGQSTTIGFVIVRVYVPTDPASLSGGVPLPDARFSLAGAQVPAQPCAQPFDPSAYTGPVADAAKGAFDRLIAGAASGAFPGNTPEATFRNPASTSGLFPNGDNKYIGTRLSYQPGRLLVVRGKAPTFPDTRAGQSPTEPTEVRYWSMCQNDLVSPYPVVACAADFQTALDGDGYYTYVVAAPADVPADLPATVTVIPWGSTAVDKVLFLRNMTPSAAFYPSSIQASQDSGADPATTMGPYYPRTTYCDTGTFAAGGAAACFGD
ncbi:hypothetical protein FEK33_06650 [Nocardia asteroides NBRC 15531]|uniref:Uncharacterized protein n=1 Tax=Nocardia asteroides NBRC 15531 TaxID=1110697 RepID=U5EFS7_NOCAS|nr:hypothetical protein FEK33_06650 [Nocardia asteroides NBRC 15531]GAD84039.1 hypothetical protein NCAST_20_06090 [Nocardia asteroides NBRC 15531]SFL90529.1 hypothetical protein SAMN05444423_1011346 [Nocardia asteroides]VEG38026.1 Uncharacterised protein [Nocardia asteroides]